MDKLQLYLEVWITLITQCLVKETRHKRAHCMTAYNVQIRVYLGRQPKDTLRIGNVWQLDTQGCSGCENSLFYAIVYTIFII